jgi:hypothetical protein
MYFFQPSSVGSKRSKKLKGKAVMSRSMIKLDLDPSASELSFAASLVAAAVLSLDSSGSLNDGSVMVLGLCM